MKLFLDGLLPRLAPNLEYVCVFHEGKTDLERSIPRKLRAWREPGVRFVVVRDNDGGDCVLTKNTLVDMCGGAGRPDTVIRIACQELESWYLGDPQALAAAFDDVRLSQIGERALFRNPDAVTRPSSELKRIVPRFQKTGGARLMGKHISVARATNRSLSFGVFVEAIRLIAQEPHTEKSGDKHGYQ